MREKSAHVIAQCKGAADFRVHTYLKNILLTGTDRHEVSVGDAQLTREAIVDV